MLKLASWNINSLKIRLDHVMSWLKSQQIDIVALQETKLIDENFPVSSFLDHNYYVAFSGQKTYNGVAIASRFPITELVTDIPGLIDPQRRILAVTIRDIRLINLYVPNGSMVGSDKYNYKLSWLKKVTEFISQQVNQYSRVAVVGDFNIAPEDRDVHSPDEWQSCVLVSPDERQAFSDLLALGLKDSFRLFLQEQNIFSWWDYRAFAFQRKRGLRIDHILLNNLLADSCLSSQIDQVPRGWVRPSDHAPVWVELAG